MNTVRCCPSVYKSLNNLVSRVQIVVSQNKEEVTSFEFACCSLCVSFSEQNYFQVHEFFKIMNNRIRLLERVLVGRQRNLFYFGSCEQKFQNHSGYCLVPEAAVEVSHDIICSANQFTRCHRQLCSSFVCLIISLYTQPKFSSCSLSLVPL